MGWERRSVLSLNVQEIPLCQYMEEVAVRQIIKAAERIILMESVIMVHKSSALGYSIVCVQLDV